MSGVTAKMICERALRAIGAFPITESAPDGEHMREALQWLGTILRHTAGTKRLFHLIPDAVWLPLEPGRAEYPLKSSLGSEYPANGIQFPVRAWLLDAGGNRTPLEIIQRDTWRKITKPSAPGVPQCVYLNRYPDPTLWTYPTLPEGSNSTYRVELDVQTYAPNVLPGGVTGDTPQGSMLHGFGEAWELWMINRLAAALASGPVLKLPQQSIALFRQEAAIAMAELEAFQNQEHDTEPPIAAPYGM